MHCVINKLVSCVSVTWDLHQLSYVADVVLFCCFFSGGRSLVILSTQEVYCDLFLLSTGVSLRTGWSVLLRTGWSVLLYWHPHWLVWSFKTIRPMQLWTSFIYINLSFCKTVKNIQTMIWDDRKTTHKYMWVAFTHTQSGHAHTFTHTKSVMLIISYAQSLHFRFYTLNIYYL